MNNLNNKIIAGVVLLFLSVPIFSQTNLNKWAAKCEQIESVDITVIKKKDPQTGKLTQNLMTISFKNNDKLYQELIDACKKDEDKAYDIIKKRKGGKDIPQIYKFREKDMDVQYIFNISKNGSVSVTIVKRDKDQKSKVTMKFGNSNNILESGFSSSW